MYHRRPVRRTVFSYLMPLIVIIAIFLVVILGWKILNNLFSDTDTETKKEGIFMNIEKGSVKAMTTELSEWQNAPDKIYLYRGEMLKTGVDSRVVLTYFDQSIVRLNEGSEVHFAQLKRKKDVSTIQTNLAKGELWAKIEPAGSDRASFGVDTERLDIDSKGGVLAIAAPGTVRVISGEAQVGIKYDDEVIKAVTVGVGQEITVNDEILNRLRSEGDAEYLQAISDHFKGGDWYRWNRHKDGAIVAYEEEAEEGEDEIGKTGPSEEDSDETEAPLSPEALKKVVYVTSPSRGLHTNKSIITIKGYYDSREASAVYVEDQKAQLTPDTNRWEIAAFKLMKEGENRLKINAHGKSGESTAVDELVIVFDKTPPAAPVVVSPGKNNEVVTIETDEQIIEGTVTADTHKVVVNDYQLGKYVPGSRAFSYYAKVAYGNIQAGENVYEVYAEDKAGNKSEPAFITLMIDEATVEAAKEGTGTETEEDGDTAAEDAKEEASESDGGDSGGVAITEPNGGEDFSTTETYFEIKGIVPAGTAKVVVNDYTLGAFGSGQTVWKYRASTRLNNLEPDAANRFTVTAYEKNGTQLGQDTLVITTVTETLTIPVITIPTKKGSYSTNLNVLAIGGTVSKATEYVYVNGEKIDYEKGSGKWRKSLTLSPGENRIRVHATKGDQKSDEAMITIKYY